MTNQEQQRAVTKRKSYFAAQNHEENEKGYKRYINLVTKGMAESPARELVKDAFGWGDRRLDRVLETRAGLLSPKTASELEAKALVFIQRIDNSIGSLCRHCDNQLDRLDDMDEYDEDGEPNWTSVELIEDVGGPGGGKTRRKKMTIANAKVQLLENKLSYNKQLFDALKALKVDTIININAGDKIGDYSSAELDAMLAEQAKADKGREIDAEFTVEK